MSELVVGGSQCEKCGDHFLYNAARGPAAAKCPQCQREERRGKQASLPGL